MVNLLLCYYLDDKDFDTAIRSVVFPADEGKLSMTYDVDVPIRVFDDEVDESLTQYFNTRLYLDSAIRPDLITITHGSSRCDILDNDGRWPG